MWGVALQLAPRPGSPADALALGVSGSATSDLATHGRSFAHLSTPFPSGNGALYAALQGLEYAFAQLSAERPRAVAIRPVLGTTVAYVDRSAVRLRVLLLAADGSAQVTTSGLGLTLDVARGASRVSVSCAVADVTRAASYFLARCEVAALPSPWFAVPSLATATVTLRYKNAVVAAADAGALTLVEQPVWYGAAQLARVRPAARPLAPAGAFAAMPASPVYAGDEFAVAVYAHTGGFALETCRSRWSKTWPCRSRGSSGGGGGTGCSAVRPSHTPARWRGHTATTKCRASCTRRALAVGRSVLV